MMEIDRYSDWKYLDRLEMEEVVGIIADSVQCTMDVMLSSTKQDKVTAFLLGLFTGDLYSFFTLPRLKKLADDVLEDDVIRGFVLNLTERASLRLTAISGIIRTNISRTIASAVTDNKRPHVAGTAQLINVEVSDTLYTGEDELVTLLEDNYWVSILYIMTAYCSASKIFDGFSKNVAS